MRTKIGFMKRVRQEERMIQDEGTEERREREDVSRTEEMRGRGVEETISATFPSTIQSRSSRNVIATATQPMST